VTLSPRGPVGDTLADDDVDDEEERTTSQPRDAGGDLLLVAARLLQHFNIRLLDG